MCKKCSLADLPLDDLGSRSASALSGLGTLTNPPTLDVPPRPVAKAKRRLWDLPHKFHCPVIGTCLHVDELRRLAQKAGCASRPDLSDFEVHVSFVAAADTKNALSLATQRVLERKYAKVVKRFSRARTRDEIEALWNEAMANGEVPGALWALMTHPCASAELRTLAYEDVHMLSHQIGAGLSADLKALADTRETLRRERQECAAASARARQSAEQKDAALADAQRRLAELDGVEAELSAARARIAALEAGQELAQLRLRVDAQDEEMAALRREARRHAASVQELQLRLEAAERQRSDALDQLADRDASLRAMEALLMAPTASEDTACDGDCGHCGLDQIGDAGYIDLCGKRVLCVGGRGSLNAHYRTLVERCNGELVRHDGGLEDNRSRLEALLASADAVVCPLDAVSHDACLRTKRFCKQHAKPCVLMQRSGVGAFARALAQLGTPPPGHAAVGSAPAPWLLRA